MIHCCVSAKKEKTACLAMGAALVANSAAALGSTELTAAGAGLASCENTGHVPAGRDKLDARAFSRDAAEP